MILSTTIRTPATTNAAALGFPASEMTPKN